MAEKKQKTEDRITLTIGRQLIDKGIEEAERRGIKSFSAFMRYLLIKELDKSQRF